MQYVPAVPHTHQFNFDKTVTWGSEYPQGKERVMEKFLPVGIQVFEQMITGNFYYVDKTRYIYEMVRPSQGFYFLARPRRFGKSLTVSTLENLFRGKRELFKDLWIGKSDWEWKEHPVITIDFSALGMSTSYELENDLLLYIRNMAEKNGITLPDKASLPFLFTNLIVNLSKKYGERVVVLMDEYDKPIIEHIGKGEEHLKIAKANRDLLKPFFGVLKGAEVSSALRFVFLTGISKFARISIFSDLNNLDDISMQERYDAVMGYTEEELESCFTDPIRRLSHEAEIPADGLRQDMRNWYDGYRFTESQTKVYNPFSIVRFLKTGRFENHWFETATPTFLLNLIRENDYPVADIENMELPKELFSVYDLDNLRLEPLLFQTGYITIRDFDRRVGIYRMGYPNQEVKTSFLSYLLNDFAGIRDLRIMGAYKNLYRYLEEKDMESFIRTVKSIYASVPYTQIANQGESYYHTMFYLMLSASGVDTDTEVLSSMGRLDMKAEFSDIIYIIELKCDQGASVAIEQILEKRYYEPYLTSGKDIFLMGIAFDSTERSISDYQWGTLGDFLPGGPADHS